MAMVGSILAAGGDDALSSTELDGSSMLVIAAQLGHLDIVRVLLRAGLHVEVCDRQQIKFRGSVVSPPFAQMRSICIALGMVLSVGDWGLLGAKHVIKLGDRLGVLGLKWSNPVEEDFKGHTPASMWAKVLSDLLYSALVQLDLDDKHVYISDEDNMLAAENTAFQNFMERRRSSNNYPYHHKGMDNNMQILFNSGVRNVMLCGRECCV